MKVHFIAIGGSAMHNLAIALQQKGYKVTGSDDEIFDPAKSRLKQYDLLPEKTGWYPEKITSDIDAVILGMHARKDNPELLKAQELGIKVYSYPEYIYNQSKKKKRVVIGGSHGKTSITAMILHVLKKAGINFDYMVGAQIQGFDVMVQLSDAPVIVLEGDEYLSSPIDLRSKFHWYRPHIAVLTGIAWDHINVFPTFETYVAQFEQFIKTIEPGGKLFYFEEDKQLQQIKDTNPAIVTEPYNIPPHTIEKGITHLIFQQKRYPLKIFGRHNLQNIQAAWNVCKALGITDQVFLEAITSFTGAGRRLEKIAQNSQTVVFKDFAHSPSKLQATTQAVKEQFPDKQLLAVMELHTYSSLNKRFLYQYNNCMQAADKAFVYYNPKTIAHKKLDPITPQEVIDAFGGDNVQVFNDSKMLKEAIEHFPLKNTVVLLMTSGNFDGIHLDDFGRQLVHQTSHL